MPRLVCGICGDLAGNQTASNNMTKHHKPKNVKLTSIARLRKVNTPLPMVGDPPSNGSMQARWNALYAQAIAHKRTSNMLQAA
jgi:hypothetical protein